jgi:hypothetical protein
VCGAVALANEVGQATVPVATTSKDASHLKDYLLKDQSIPPSIEPSANDSGPWRERRESLRLKKVATKDPQPAIKGGPAGTDARDLGTSPRTKFSGGMEDFEGAFPGIYWFVGDENPDGGTQFWDDVGCASSTGDWSAWCADIGTDPDCTEYSDNQDAFMYVEAEYLGATYNDNNKFYYDRLVFVEDFIDEPWDYFHYRIEGYIENPGHGVTGTPDALFEFTLSGDEPAWSYRVITLNEPFDVCFFVRISFMFHSDGSITDSGAYVDNVEFNSRADTAIYPYREGFPDPRPDLEILDIFLGDGPGLDANTISNPQIGQEVYAHLRYHVKSHDVLEIPIWNLSLDGAVQGTFTGTALAATTQVGWLNAPWVVTEGEHVWCATLDPSGVLEETSEFNNSMCATFTIFPTETASFGGRVTNSTTGTAVPFAQVTWGTHTTQTDSAGDYFFENVSCTEQALNVSKAGFVNHFVVFTPPCGTTTTQNISLISSSGDSDQDGMNDEWELSFGLNPNDSSDASSDNDGDGLSNREEFDLGSDPTDINDPTRNVFVAPPPAGNNSSGTGTAGAPWATIALAMSRTAPFATLDRPVTINLAAGTYPEKVVLEPHIILQGADSESPEITVIQHYDPGDSEHIVMFGAEGASIRNVKVTFPDVYVAPVAILRISDVGMVISNCVLDGRFNQSSTGILISGPGSSGTIVEDSIFTRLNDAIWVVDSAVTVTRNWFDRISGDAIFIALPPGKQDGQTPQLGDAGDTGGTGFNTFGEVDGSLVQNGNPNRETKAEFNAWGLDNEGDIDAQMSGDVDFLPFLGKSLGPGTVAAAVLDATTEELIGDVARPAVEIPELNLSALRDDVSRVFSFPALTPGNWTASAEADGYRPGDQLIAVSSLHTTTAIFFLEKEGTVDPPDPTEPVDINGDGGVDASDIQLVINAVLGLDINGLIADVNTDAQVNASDIQLVINAVLGVG